MDEISFDRRAGEIVGREQERIALAAFVAESVSWPRGLVLEGEAGVGKTTLWRAALESAAESGWRVLSSRPTASDSRLAFAGLGDLLAGTEAVASELPGPQRRALASMLLLEEPSGEPDDERAVALAVLGVLRALARELSTLVAIDDWQWLDERSARVLTFALRRLGADRVAVIATRTSGVAAVAELGLIDWLVPMPLGPLSLGALHRMLRLRLGVTLPRPALRRLHERSAGNPLYALELARHFDDRGRAMVTMPTSLHDSFRRRLFALPPPQREALFVVAVAAEPTIGLLDGVLGGVELAPVFGDLLLEAERGRLRFSHPLLAVAAEEVIPPPRRRELHRAIGGLAREREERARHHALGADGPDPEIAAELEAAAALAHARGAPARAADLLEQSLMLTPPQLTDQRRGRIVAAADAHFDAGTPLRAQTLLNAAAEQAESAEVLWRLGTIRGELGAPEDAVECYQRALAIASDEPLRARILADLAWMSLFAGDPGLASEHARAARVSAEASGERHALVAALTASGFIETMVRGHVEPTGLQTALEVEREVGTARVDRSPRILLANHQLWGGRLDEARPLLEELREIAISRGDEANESAPLFYVCMLEALAGEFDRAERYGREGLELSEQSGVNRLEMQHANALLDARRGRTDTARRQATLGIEQANRAGEHLMAIRELSLLGMIELTAGNAHAASTVLLEALQRAATNRILGASVHTIVPDAVEALTLCGTVDQAQTTLNEFERAIGSPTQPWPAASLARSHGFLSAATGDLNAALTAFETAAAVLSQLPLPLEHARALLALGQAQVRATRKRAGRDTLQAALARFQQLGLEAAAAKTSIEIARVGGRRPAGATLTPAEDRIAKLVVEGRSNKQVASELFITVSTVEATLSRIYSKLAIRSRAQLAHRLTQPSDPGHNATDR